MKLLTFRTADGNECVGVLIEPDRTQVLCLAATATAANLPGAGRSLVQLLHGGPAALDTIRQLLLKPQPTALRQLDAIELLPPLHFPAKVLAVARNYREHIEEFGQQTQAQDMQAPHIFMKPPTTTVIGPGAAIRIPPVAQSIDWEGELAVVIGRSAKAVSPADALDYVAGYTIMNDVSERHIRIRERQDPRPRDHFFDWLNGKWYDTFAPLGPWIVTADEIPDPQALSITTSVNGQVKQDMSTARMIFSVRELIAYCSAFITLEPGDVISTGTIAGVGAASGQFLQPGDRVEIRISGIGVLQNTVEASEC